MDFSELVREAEVQGWRIEETRKGYMLLPPDKTLSGVLVHRQPTEQALKKNLSQMRQRGFQWPPPSEPKGGEDA